MLDISSLTSPRILTSTLYSWLSVSTQSELESCVSLLLLHHLWIPHFIYAPINCYFFVTFWRLRINSYYSYSVRHWVTSTARSSVLPMYSPSLIRSFTGELFLMYLYVRLQSGCLLRIHRHTVRQYLTVVRFNSTGSAVLIILLASIPQGSTLISHV